MNNKLNLNEKIRFKITPTGKKFLENRKLNLPLDKEGYCTLSLWEFAGTFGEAMQLPTFSPVVEPEMYLVLRLD